MAFFWKIWFRLNWRNTVLVYLGMSALYRHIGDAFGEPKYCGSLKDLQGQNRLIKVAEVTVISAFSQSQCHQTLDGPKHVLHLRRPCADWFTDRLHALHSDLWVKTWLIWWLEGHCHFRSWDRIPRKCQRSLTRLGIGWCQPMNQKRTIDTLAARAVCGGRIC